MFNEFITSIVGDSVDGISITSVLAIMLFFIIFDSICRVISSFFKGVTR